jgi:hypothetical protein
MNFGGNWALWVWGEIEVNFSYCNCTWFSNNSQWRFPKQILIQIWPILADLNSTDEYCQQMWVFKNLILVQNHDTDLDKWQSLGSCTASGKETCSDNCYTRLAWQNVLSCCISWRVLSRSGKSKHDLKGVCGCRENRKLMCSCTGWGEETHLGNCHCQFAAENVFCLCISW